MYLFSSVGRRLTLPVCKLAAIVLHPVCTEMKLTIDDDADARQQQDAECHREHGQHTKD